MISEGMRNQKNSKETGFSIACQKPQTYYGYPGSQGRGYSQKGIPRTLQWESEVHWDNAAEFKTRLCITRQKNMQESRAMRAAL